MLAMGSPSPRVPVGPWYRNRVGTEGFNSYRAIIPISRLRTVVFGTAESYSYSSIILIRIVRSNCTKICILVYRPDYRHVIRGGEELSSEEPTRSTCLPITSECDGELHYACHGNIHHPTLIGPYNISRSSSLDLDPHTERKSQTRKTKKRK